MPATTLTTDNVKRLSDFSQAALTDDHLLLVTDQNGGVGYKTSVAALRSQIMSKRVWLTQDAYDALVAAGTVDATIEYNIYEDET